ncbi:hypothetical protein SKAU_G00274920 [Synaphobranchus kaupii]|uniref:BEN domain-containing protein n=1 Tax=Synaphobranchus kaupii TaxID=118154 RepID=A0A9Q1F120_SYNKA|nr:hypothetical protein SKAU_G00274920 [Synaphobranchus kaupii]
MLQDMMSQMFARKEIATHSLTGSKSNANCALEPRPQLDKTKMDLLFRRVERSCPTVQMEHCTDEGAAGGSQKQIVE